MLAVPGSRVSIVQKSVSKVGVPCLRRWVLNAARGISDEPVVSKDVPKSMLAAKSFDATSDWTELEHWLRVLCEELAHRMVADTAAHNRRPRNLVVHWRWQANKNAGAGVSRSRRALLLSSASGCLPIMLACCLNAAAKPARAVKEP